MLTETFVAANLVAALHALGSSGGASPPPKTPLPPPPLEPAPIAVANDAPTCSDIELRIVTESSDPSFSRATLATTSEPSSRVRRAGDGVGNATLEVIGYNARRMSPAAWFRAADTTCQALLFEPPARKHVPAEPTAPSPARTPRSRLRVVPEFENGTVVGIRLLGVHKDSVLGTLGFENGDRIQSVNGFDVTSPEKALQAYARLRSASHVKVAITRRGRPLTLEYYIR